MAFADRTCVLALGGDGDCVRGALGGLGGGVGASAADTPESIAATPGKS